MTTDLREDLGDALKGQLSPEHIEKLLTEVLAIEKRVSAEFKCKSCDQRQMVWTTVLDAKAVTSALVDLSNQAFGRPMEASAHQDPIQFYRLVDMEELEEVKEKTKKQPQTT